MKRTWIIGILSLAIVAVLGLTAFSYAQAAGGRGSHERPFSGERMAGHRDEPGLMQPYFESAAADILGVSVEELEAARGDRTAMAAMLEDAGLTIEEFRAAMDAALPDAVAQALEDGVITEDQAEFILENGWRRPNRQPRRGFGPLNPYVVEASADILGIDVEELQAALEDGTPIEEILDEAGVTVLEYRMALDAATQDIVDQALEDGAITDEQAEKILEYGLWPARCRDGFRGKHHGAPPVEDTTG